MEVYCVDCSNVKMKVSSNLQVSVKKVQEGGFKEVEFLQTSIEMFCSICKKSVEIRWELEA